MISFTICIPSNALKKNVFSGSSCFIGREPFQESSPSHHQEDPGYFLFLNIYLFDCLRFLLQQAGSFIVARGLSTCGMWVLSHFSHVRFFATPWTVACQGPLFMGFSWQEYRSGLPCHSPEDLPDPGIKPTSQIKNFCILCKPVSLI